MVERAEWSVVVGGGGVGGGGGGAGGWWFFFFFFKQKTAYEIKECDWSSDVCSSDLQEAERLSRIVDDLLDLSLIESMNEPQCTPVAVRELLVEAVNRMRSTADSAQIEIRLAEPDPTLAATVDRRWIVSALANLLDNAIKYSEPGAVVDIGAVSEQGRLVISVRDDGIGIPARDLKRIFERFYRVDRARSRATGGTGLGLSIVRHVARMHGGKVEVQSREGIGSLFLLILPGATSLSPGLLEMS